MNIPPFSYFSHSLPQFPFLSSSEYIPSPTKYKLTQSQSQFDFGNIMATTQFADAQEWVSIRQAIGSAMFIGYLFYLVAYYLSLFRKQDRPNFYICMNDIGGKMYLFGIACLLSINFYQTGIFQAIVCYLTMLMLIALVVVCFFDSLGDKARSGAFLLYYMVLFAWFMGIVIDYFNTNDV